MVEKTISEQIDFFHLNLVSSSMVIKVDFDLTMSILALNLYRLFADELERYSNSTAQTLYDKFVLNGADIEIGEKAIKVLLKKKRQLPLILETMQEFNKLKYPLMGKKNLIFEEYDGYLRTNAGTGRTIGFAAFRMHLFNPLFRFFVYPEQAEIGNTVRTGYTSHNR